jgi:hypothetical protein
LSSIRIELLQGRSIQQVLGAVVADVGRIPTDWSARETSWGGAT